MKILIKNTLVLLFENDKFYTEKTNICIDGETILSVGEIPEKFSPETIIDGGKFLAIPGLVNTHAHSYMSLFRNIADDLSFEDWLFKTINPLEDKLTSEDAYNGVMLACTEMLKTGTVAFLDMHMFEGVTAKAALKLKMKAVLSRGLVGTDRNDEGGKRRIEEALREKKEYEKYPLIDFMLAPHAIYTCGEDYLKLIIETAHEYNLPIHTHLSETTAEVENCKKEHGGKTPAEYLNSLGMFESKTVAAHCVHLTENDMDILSSKGVFVSHNPKSNLKLGNGIAPIKKLLEKNANIVMGTDSAASNNSLNLFSDMNFAALLHKTNDPQAVSAQNVLKFATINGARALNTGGGEIKKGKKADIVLLDLNNVSFIPQNDPVSALCYSTCGYETDTVIINGKIVLKDKHLVNADEEEIYFNAKKSIERLKS